ncbi:hypothetical protein JX266_002234 [Neoarthrinium moseri]|nr:hypothetical protein JX266_002234 [Neoarthrinium moseri]
MAFSSRRPPPFQDGNGSIPVATAPHRRPRANPPNAPFLRDHFAAAAPHAHGRQIQSDSSSEDEVPVPRPADVRSRPQHSRSMSHPFPSLFASKKPRKQPSPDGLTDDDTLRTGPAISRPGMASTKPPRGPTDFSNGTCMTCGGKVRWPKELDVFRCKICMTINDLKPYAPKSEDARPPGSTRPLSLERTRTLLQQCLLQALKSFSADGSMAPPGWPSRSSSRPSDGHLPKFDSPAGHSRSGSHSGTGPAFKHNPVFDDFASGYLEPNPVNRVGSGTRSYSTSFPDARSSTIPATAHLKGEESLDPRKIFKPVEDYLVASFGFRENINAAFVPRRHSFSSRPQMQIKRKPVPLPRQEKVVAQEKPLSSDDSLTTELDAKLLLVGDFAENAQWWTGGQRDGVAQRSRSQQKGDTHGLVTPRSARIDWGELLEWYQLIIDAARPWLDLYNRGIEKTQTRTLSQLEKQRFEAVLIEAQGHLQRVLLKCTETLLKRPGQLLQEPQDIRFLLLIIVNPLLTSGHKSYAGEFQHLSKDKGMTKNTNATGEEGSAMGRHSGIIKRILGLISNTSDQCHHHLVTWLSKLPEHLFFQTKDLISSFVNYRLQRQSEKKIEARVDLTAGLIPEMPNSRTGNTPASLHAALSASNGSKKARQSSEAPRLIYGDDWQLKAGAKVMALVFAANNLTHVRRNEVSVRHAHGHLLATSDFYNSMLDCLDFKTDFEMWESRKGKFAFCQYPFFLSIWAKIQILEFDAKRQMHGKAREAFFDSILSNRSYTQYLFLSVRRDCLVEDSLAKVSEVVGSGSEDIKKGLRIEFQGEEGVDAGGLRKEWFQLLVKEVFNPDHGLFVFDEDSQYCYFNPHTFETTDQYFLVGVVLGLAIYNSTILDIAFPPFAFRKLLASAPSSATSSTAHQRPVMTYTLDDLAEYRPRLANGLRKLLDFDGDVENTFCLDFVVEVEKYGARTQVPLCRGGDRKPVTNANRREYVDLYVKYLLDESVKRQFEPFKRGFFTVCAGNALSLFRPEEIELLVRGSDEPLDITSLRAVARYIDWSKKKSELEPEHEPTIDWFWESFAAASPSDQRRLLSFITGSDRIPAMGAASLVIKISCLGEDIGRYPSARTCFNVLNLYRYRTRERLEFFLWQAVHESEGFGLR